MSYISGRLLVLMFLIGVITLRPLWLNALNAAPPLTDSPARFFALSDEELLKKAFDYKSADKPDSALLCYAVVAQRYTGKSSGEELRHSMKAKLEAGNLYYYPFYDYGKAYSLFREVYDIAADNNDYEYMGLAANTIGNVLSVYNCTNYSETRDREIIDYYSRSVDYLLKAGKWNDLIPTLNNLMAIAMDTTHLDSVMPVLLKYYNRNLADTVNDHRFTRERIGGYLKIGEGDYAGAANVFRKMLGERRGMAGSPVGRIQVYFDLAGVANIEGCYDSVIYYARKVQELAKAHDMYEVVPGAYLLEADMYKAKGNELLGEKAMLKYYEAKDSLLTLSTISLFSEAHLKKKIADIDVELVRVSAENRMRKVIVGFVTALLGVVTIFLFIVWRKNRVLIRKNQEMIEKAGIIERQDKIILHHTIDELKRNRKEDTEGKPGNPELLSKIVEIMEQSDEIYDSGFSIDTLAHLCGEKTKVVSAELNSSLGKNFNTLLNEYRVREMCRRLEDSSKSGFTIEGIAQEVGFKSRATYISAFKKVTGLTPSEYMKVKSRLVKVNVQNPENTE